MNGGWASGRPGNRYDPGSVVSEIESVFSSGESLRPTRDMFSNMEPAADVKQLAAVDGSSTIIVSGPNFIVGAYRASALIYRGHGQVQKNTGPMELTCINPENMNELYGRAFSEFVGAPPDRGVRDLETALQRLRVIEEMKMLSRVAGEMDPGGIILMDGSLRSTINRMDAFLSDVFKDALERGISVVGISKSSGLAMGRVPIIPIIQLEAEQLMGNAAWYIELDTRMSEVVKPAGSHLFGKVNVVKFNPHSEFVFRTDVLAGQRPLQDIIERVAFYCNDPSYLGYPYPLAAVHNEVVITRSQKEDMGHEMRDIALERGIRGIQWKCLCQDFHDVLDRGI